MGAAGADAAARAVAGWRVEGVGVCGAASKRLRDAFTLAAQPAVGAGVPPSAGGGAPCHRSRPWLTNILGLHVRVTDRKRTFAFVMHRLYLSPRMRSTLTSNLSISCQVVTCCRRAVLTVVDLGSACVCWGLVRGLGLVRCYCARILWLHCDLFGYLLMTEQAERIIYVTTQYVVRLDSFVRFRYKLLLGLFRGCLRSHLGTVKLRPEYFSLKSLDASTT